jgi:hypothetical protein
MDKSVTIDRDFTLSDSTVNVYGFRLLTDGYEIGEYEKNPIGYYMHDRDGGVVLKWTDLHIDGDRVCGRPSVNMSNPRGQQTLDEIQNGFLNAASVGHIVVLEWSDDPALRLPGQSGPTVTRWYNRECSIVDIPGNVNAIALFDKDDNPINLSDFTNGHRIMKQTFLSTTALASLQLSADADPSLVETTIQNLVVKANKVDQLHQENTQLKADKDKAVGEFQQLKASASAEKVDGMLAQAVKDGKVTQEVATKLRAKYEGNPEDLQDLLAAIPIYTPLVNSLKDDQVPEEWKGTWDDLHRANKLEDLKAKNPDVFKIKYKEKYGKEYAGK